MARLIDITGKAVSGEWGFDDETGDGIPVIRTTNFTNDGVVNYNDIVTRKIIKKNLDEKYLRKGDIIIEKSGGSDKFPVGRVIYFDGEENTYLFNNFTGLLRVKNQELWYTKYVFYSLFFNYKRGGTRAFENKTTGLHNLKTDEYVRRYEVTERSRNEQILICEKLDRAYSIIKSRQLELLLLDELIKARFVEMFGDPDTNPMNWDTYRLDECYEIASSKRILKSEWKSEGIPFLRVRDMVQLATTGQMDNEFYVSEEFYSTLKDTDGIPRVNDILVSATSTLGKCHIVNEGERFYFKDADVLRFRAKKDINPVFFVEQMKSSYIEEQIARTLGVTTVAHFTIKAAKTINMRLPDITLQNQFADFVHQVDKSKVAVQKALDETQILFDSLMQKYFG